MGSFWYEVLTRFHIVWCRSFIGYHGPMVITLKIFLNSCLLPHKSGILCLARSEVVVPVSVSVSYVNGSFTIEGEGESESQVCWEQSQLCQEHTTQQDVHNFRWKSPHRCSSHNTEGKITRITLSGLICAVTTIVITSFM